MIRSVKIDLLRGILIILVIVGHYLQYIMYNKSSFYNNIDFIMIYSFHMPMFFLISGYLSFNSINNRDTSKNFSSRFKQLIIPAIVWSVVIQVGYILFLNKSFLLNEIIHTSFNSFWFLWALFLSHCTTKILSNVSTKPFFMIILMLVLYFIVPEVQPLIYFKFALPFYILGYSINLCEFNKMRFKLYHVAAFAIIFIVLISLWEEKTFVYLSGMSINYNNLVNILLRLATGIVGSLLLFALIDFLNIKSSLITKIGSQTMVIYIIQTIIFGVISNFGSHLPVINVWLKFLGLPISVVVIIIISFLINKIITRNKILSKLLLGVSI